MGRWQTAAKYGRYAIRMARKGWVLYGKYAHKINLRGIFRHNPTLGEYLLPFTLLSGLGLLMLYPIYTSARHGRDFALPFFGNVLLGLLTLWLFVTMFRVGRRLLSERRLNRRAALIVTAFLLVANPLLACLGLSAVYIGGFLNPLTSSNYLLATVPTGSATFSLLFYPFHLATGAVAAVVLIFLLSRPLKAFGNEHLTPKQLKVALALSQPEEEARAVVFYDVWVSSVKHLDAHTRLVQETSPERRKVGRYRIPDGFPQIHLAPRLPLRGGPLPAVFFAYGALKIGRSEIVFHALNRSPRVRWYRMHFFNLQNRCHFQLSRPAIKRVRWYQHPDAVLPQYKFPWIELETSRGTLLLLSGIYPEDQAQRDKLKARTHKLLATLQHVQRGW